MPRLRQSRWSSGKREEAREEWKKERSNLDWGSAVVFIAQRVGSDFAHEEREKLLAGNDGNYTVSTNCDTLRWNKDSWDNPVAHVSGGISREHPG